MSSTVKVSNKTAGATGILAQFRLVNVELEVCGEMVAPGGSRTVPTEDWLLNKAQYARLLKLGALVAEDVADEKSAGPALVSLASDASVSDEKPWKKKKSTDTEG